MASVGVCVGVCVMDPQGRERGFTLIRIPLDDLDWLTLANLRCRVAAVLGVTAKDSWSLLLSSAGQSVPLATDSDVDAFRDACRAAVEKEPEDRVHLVAQGSVLCHPLPVRDLPLRVVR